MTDKPDDIPLEFKDWVKAYYVKAGFISSTDELRAAWDAAANAQLRRLHALNAELLEALKGIIKAEHSEGRGGSGFIPKAPTLEHQQRVYQAWQKAHAAIARAEDKQ